MVIENMIALILGLILSYVWIIGGHICIGFIEDFTKKEVSLANAMKIYIFWPFVPLMTQVKCLLGII